MLLVEMARDGQGVTWSPRSLVEADLLSGPLTRAGNSDWDIPIEVRLFRARLRLAATAELFWEQAKRLAAGEG